MSPESIETVLPLLKLLANETRLRVIGLVADGEQSVGSLARRLEVTEATMSHHLSKLTASGLLTMRAEGTTHYFRLDPEALAAINKSLLRPAKLMRAPPSASGSGAKARILQSFIEDGRLKKIPESHAKRQVVLEWVVDQLEDRRYREREISEILKRHFDDYATLRRELINHRLMVREHGIYWKAGK
jgi:transposase-like protein